MSAFNTEALNNAQQQNSRLIHRPIDSMKESDHFCDVFCITESNICGCSLRSFRANFTHSLSGKVFRDDSRVPLPTPNGTDRIAKARSTITGVNLRQKGEENRLKALILVCKFGVASIATISDHLGNQNQSVARKLTNAGFLREIILERAAYTEAHGAVRKIVVLTRAAHEFLVAMGVAIVYPELETGRINFNLVSHTLESQIAVSSLLKKGVIDDFETERMWGANNATSKRFDVIGIKGNQRIGIEIELTPKNGRRFDEMCSGIVKALQAEKDGEHHFTYALIYVRESIRVPYQKALQSGSKIGQWHINSGGKWVKTIRHFEVPTSIASRIFFPAIEGG